MRRLMGYMMAVLVGSLLPACTADLGNCDIDPTADCFKGKGGSSGTSAGGSAGAAGSGCDCKTDTTCGKCNGEGCTDGSACKTGQCVDGFCCESACDGDCVACSMALTGQPNGVCAALLPASIGSECGDKGGCSMVVGHCLCDDGVLNGTETDIDCGGVCGATCTAGQTCVDGVCADGLACIEGVCCAAGCDVTCHTCVQEGAKGLCVATPGKDCGSGVECSPYGECKKDPAAPCGSGGECSTNECGYLPGSEGGNRCLSCPDNTDCGGGPCFNYWCVTAQANGAPCADGLMCMSGQCVDGVCCENDCAGACKACSGIYTGGADGSCLPIKAGYDPQGECGGMGKAAACDGNGSCGAN